MLHFLQWFQYYLKMYIFFWLDFLIYHQIFPLWISLEQLVKERIKLLLTCRSWRPQITCTIDLLKSLFLNQIMSGHLIGFGEEIKNSCQKKSFYARLSTALGLHCLFYTMLEIPLALLMSSFHSYLNLDLSLLYIVAVQCLYLCKYIYCPIIDIIFVYAVHM